MSDGTDRNQVVAAMTDDGRTTPELIDAYRAGAERMREVLSGMDAGALAARPHPERMTALEVLGHVTDSEQYFADRMKRTISMSLPMLMGVDGMTYIDGLSYDKRDPELQLTLIEVTRAQMAEDLERLAEETFTRTAIHSEIGVVTLRQLLLHAIRHLEHHADTIVAKREALGL